MLSGLSVALGVSEIQTFIVLSLIILAGSFFLSLVLTGLVRILAMRSGFVSRPIKDRFSTRTVPLGGGISIFLTIAASILTAIVIVKFLAVPGRLDWLGESVTIHTPGFQSRTGQMLNILLVVFVLFLLGLWDDRKNLGPVFKLVVEFAAAFFVAIMADVRVEFFIENKIVTSLLSACWIVVIINSFNFLDNMDGASAGIAVISSCVLFVAAAINGQVFIGGLALVFIGALLGFLVFNFPPAKIFMGDAGSLVIGFFVALLTLRTTYYNQAGSGSFYPVFLPLVAMAVPLYDFTSVFILRIIQGKSPFVGDTQHFSHRLKRRGLTETQTVLTLYLATLCTGLGAIFLYQVNLVGAILIFVQTIMVLAIIAILETTVKNDRATD